MELLSWVFIHLALEKTSSVYLGEQLTIQSSDLLHACNEHNFSPLLQKSVATLSKMLCLSKSLGMLGRSWGLFLGGKFAAFIMSMSKHS